MDPVTHYCRVIEVEKKPPHIHLVLGEYRLGSGDPTSHLDATEFSRAMLTPAGPGVVVIRSRTDETVCVEGHGPGADWILFHRRELLGLDDKPPRIEALHQSVARAQRSFGSLPLGRSLCPYQEVLMAILGQRITAREAASQWHRLVRRIGSRAPGPVDLLLPPSPRQLIDMPLHDFHALGIERSRATRLKNAAMSANFLDTVWDASASVPSAATTKLMNVEGVGRWTAAVAGSTAFGDADALRVGDFHIKNLVSWALRGLPRGTDEEMEALVEPYTGHRHRIIRWLQLDGWTAPARGPRRAIVAIQHI